MLFQRASAHYGESPAPETPYQKAGQVWDERIGSARVQARNWRLMAFGSLTLSAGLSAALVWQTASGSIVPWVVQVDHLAEPAVERHPLRRRDRGRRIGARGGARARHL